MLINSIKAATLSRKKPRTAQKGSAMGWLVLIMVVLIGFAAFVIQVVDNNTAQLEQQEQGLKAFYAAESGINIGVAALLTPTGQQPGDATKDDTLYWRYQTARITTEIKDSIEVDTDGTKVEITIKAVEDAAGLKWVEISSKGSVTYRKQVIERTNVLRVSMTDPAITKRVTS